MINLETIAPTPREAGVVYTKPWVVELVLQSKIPDKKYIFPCKVTWGK